MTSLPKDSTLNESIHSWLHKINLSFVPGPMTPVLEEVIDGMRQELERLGHNIQEIPDNSTDVVLTTAPFGEPLSWRKALIFQIRRLYNLNRTPTFYTLVQVSPEELQRQLDYFAAAIEKDTPDPADFDFPGLAPDAHRVLYDQGHRGGPLLALERLVQAYVKSIRVLLVVADDHPLEVYHFDLVGANPRSIANGTDAFYEDIVLRLVTSMSTIEVKDHQIIGDPVSENDWKALSTLAAMSEAGRQIGERGFFTDMVHISDIVDVPKVTDTIADQYSEGCFATWDPQVDALISTVTGSARPVDKGAITEEDLAVIVGVRLDGMGAQVRHVEGKRNDPPSTEAVELIDMDNLLPKIELGPEWDVQARVPVVRSKLHGHRGIKTYDPCCVEYVPLDPPYYSYPVSCATNAQAQGIKAAFSRSECLQNPEDPRQIAFTVLPGHGVVIAEKWVPGKEPFQLIWEAMDSGYLEVDNLVPQGAMEYTPAPDGRMILQAE